MLTTNQLHVFFVIQAIRDKDPKPAIDSLLKLGLINEVGHAKTPGHPILYTVTQKFYDLFDSFNERFT